MKKSIQFLLLAIILSLSVSSFAETSTNLKIRKETKDNVTIQSFVDSDGMVTMAEDLGYAYFETTFISKSKTRETKYFDASGNPCNNKDGYSLVRIKYNGKNIEHESYFDVAGNAALGPEGFAEKKTTWFQSKKHIETWLLDANGNPIQSQTMYAHRLTEYKNINKYRLPVSDSYYDAQGNLFEYGDYARIEYEYQGTDTKPAKITYLNANGEPVYYKKAGYAIFERVYENGKFRKEAYYGENGELIAGPKGYAYVELLYNSKGSNSLQKMYYNADGTAFVTEEGYCGITEITQGKKVVETYYFGEDGEPGYCNDGYSAWKCFYLSNGKESSKTFYDHNGQLMIVDSLGYAGYENKYNSKRLLKTTYIGTDREPIDAACGYAIVEYLYDRNKKPAGVRYLHADGNTPATNEEGYSYAIYESDKNGDLLSEVYYDESGALILNDKGVSETRYKWLNDQEIEEAYYHNGEAVCCLEGYHRVVYDYNGAEKVTEERYFGTDGQPVVLADGYAGIEYEYGTDGKVMSTRYYGADGNLILTAGKEYAYTRKVLFDEDTQEEKGTTGYVMEYYGTDGCLMNISAGYAQKICETNEAGKVAKEYYLDENGEPVSNVDGIGITETTYEGKNTTGIAYYDEYEKRIIGSTGYSYYTAKNNGNKWTISYFDDQGQLILLQNEYAIMEREYDEAGNVTVESYYGLNGEPVCHKKNRYHRVEKEYLDAKHVTREAWFDAAGQPMVLDNTYTSVEKEYDEKLRTTVARYYDGNGEPTLCKDGYAELRYVSFNEKNKATRYEYYGTDGQLILLPNEYAIMEREYDEAGNVTVESYYGISGEPVCHKKNKYHRVEKEYLDAKHVTREAWFDTDEQPMALKDTYTAIEKEYDDELRVVVERNYGADGEKVLCKAGYAEVHNIAFDEKNRVTRYEYYGLDSQLILLPNEYAIMEREYDEAGNVTVESYYGLNGEPVCHKKNRYHRVEKEYLDAKHVTREAWFDAVGQSMVLDNTYTSVEKEYDEKLRTTVARYYDGNGEPILCKDGYAEVRHVSFNEKNKATRYEYYGTDGQLILLPNEYAIMEREYDEAGNVTVESYYGISGEPVCHKKNKYHRVEKEYLDAKHVTREAWFDTDEQPMALKDTYTAIEKEYDDELRVVAERYYGADGGKILCKAGYAEVHNTAFDEKNRVIRYEYYGLDSQLTLLPNEYAIMEREYDEAGNVSKESYYGINGEPVYHKKNKYHRVEKEYLDAKHVLREAWFDAAGQPMVPKNTYSVVEKEFDDSLRTVTERYYDKNGEPVLCKAGYAEIRYTAFNKKNKATRYEYYGIDGDPVLVNNQYFVMERDYDDDGNVTEERCYDLNGQPVTLEEKE